jgi:hypothetical protein
MRTRVGFASRGLSVSSIASPQYSPIIMGGLFFNLNWVGGGDS